MSERGETVTRDQGEEMLRPAAVLGVCVLLGLVLGGYMLGSQLRDFKRADRYVEVKGLVERTVKSDQADWSLPFKTPGDDLAAAFASSEASKNAVLQFLAAQGFTPAEVTVGSVQVTDKATNEYDSGREKAPRYIVHQTVSVSSKDVDKVMRAGQKTADLVKAGVVLAGGTNGTAGGISYSFTGLNALKPDMITEATRNARASADRFAQDSGSAVGTIRSANQGVFSITAAGEVSADPEGGGPEQGAAASMMKKVRVVSTIDYYLK